MKSSLTTLAFFAIGVVFGRYALSGWTTEFDSLGHIALCALLLCVGMGIGSDRNILATFRSLNPALALLPVLSVAGALTGTLLAALLMGQHSVGEWLAVGSGMGYYSVSSVIISGMKDAELGAVALLANIVREVVTLLAAPLMARLFGTLAPIAAAGATAMDTTLPIISRTCSSRYVPLSIYSGMATDFSVPLLVTLFCSI